MKRLLVAFLFVVCLFSQGGAPQLLISQKIAAASQAVVQSHICVGDFGTSTTCVFSSNVVSGNILVAWAFGGGTVTSWSAATGSGTGCGSTTFSLQGTPGTGAQSLSTGTASGSGSCTITIGGSGMADVTGAIYEISGGSLTGTQLSTYDTVNCTNCTGAGLTTSSVSMVLTFMLGGGPYSSPSPFSYDVNTTDSLGFNVGAGHYLQPSSGSYTPTWTNNSNADVNNVSFAIP